MAKHENKVKTSALMEYMEAGDTAFSVPAALGDTAIVGVWDIASYRKIGISVRETSGTAALTVYVYISCSRVRPTESTHATLITEMQEITGGGQAVAKSTTVDIAFALNSLPYQEALNNARWVAVEVIDGAGTASADVGIQCKT